MTSIDMASADSRVRDDMHDHAVTDAVAESTDGRIDVGTVFPRLADLDDRSLDEQIAAYRSTLDQLKAELDGLRTVS